MMFVRFGAVVLTASLFGSGLAAQEVGTEKQQSWFEKLEIDLGRYLEGETAKGSFEFKNGSGKEQQITSFQPSCTCSKAFVRIGDETYTVSNEPRPNTIYRIDSTDSGEERTEVKSISIGPDQGGRVDVEVDLRGVTGPKEASITVYTTDGESRVMNLKAKAVATQFFRVVPPEINLNKMHWQDKREFVVQITSPIQKQFKITGHDELPEKMSIKTRMEERDGQSVWIVEGTYGPNIDPDAPGGIINLQTDVDGKKVPVRVMAFVTGPLEVRPGTFLALGMVRRGKGATKTVEFEPTDDFDLQVESVTFENLTVDKKYISYEAVKEGKVLKFSVKISPEVPQVLVRGDVKVKLNHPAAPVHDLQFNGFVR